MRPAATRRERMRGACSAAARPRPGRRGMETPDITATTAARRAAQTAAGAWTETAQNVRPRCTKAVAPPTPAPAVSTATRASTGSRGRSDRPRAVVADARLPRVPALLLGRVEARDLLDAQRHARERPRGRVGERVERVGRQAALVGNARTGPAGGERDAQAGPPEDLRPSDRRRDGSGSRRRGHCRRGLRGLRYDGCRGRAASRGPRRRSRARGLGGRGRRRGSRRRGRSRGAAAGAGAGAPAPRPRGG